MSFKLDGLATRMVYIEVTSQHFCNTVPGYVIPEQAKTEKPRFQIVLEEYFALVLMPPSFSGTAFGIDKSQELLIGVGVPFSAFISETINSVEDLFRERAGNLIGRAGNPV